VHALYRKTLTPLEPWAIFDPRVCSPLRPDCTCLHRNSSKVFPRAPSRRPFAHSLLSCIRPEQIKKIGSPSFRLVCGWNPQAATTIMAKELSMTSRSGSDNQRYGPKGERLVAGIVPLSADKTRVLLIQSTRRNGWVLPKGGWELDEATASAAACREAWEEAGILCRVERDLGHIPDTRPSTTHTKQAPKASYHFFEAVVTEERSDWPERHKRSRQWYAYGQAVQLLTTRPELLEALRRSSLKK